LLTMAVASFMWKCNLVFLAWKPFVISKSLNGWQSLLESTLNPISLTVVHLKHMPLFVILKITTNRNGVADNVDALLWPLAVMYAAHLFNNLPNE
jgi:hypothetical protein